jgi:heme-degrading monooxygenase HmoA
MVARVSIYELPGERVDEAVESFRSAFDQIKALEGFSEGFFLVCPEDDRAKAVTFWESRAAMDASRVTASRLRADAARTVEGSVVSVNDYEIALHVVGDAVDALDAR